MNEFMPEKPKQPAVPVLLALALVIGGFGMGYLTASEVYKDRVKTWYNKAVEYGYGVAIYRAIAITQASKTNDPMDKEAEATIDGIATKMMKLLRKDEAAK